MDVDTEEFRIFKITPNDLADRLIVEAYLPEKLEIRNKLRGCPSLGVIADIKCGSTPRDKTAFYGGNVLFLKTQHVQEGYLDLKEKFYVNQEAHNSILENSKVYPADILLTIIGASFDVIGRAVMFPKKLGEANINQNIARIRVFNPEKIKPEYVEAFMDSPLGRMQSQMMSRVVGQYNLNLPEVRAVRIPIPPLEIQQSVIDIWQKAKSTRKENLSKIRELSEIIDGSKTFSNLDIEMPDLSCANFFMTQSPDLQSNLTVEHYRSKLIENILSREKEKLGLQRLVDLVEFHNEYVKPKDYPDRFYQLLQVSHNGTSKLREERLGEEIKYETMKTVKTGDVIVSRIGAIYGATSIVPKRFDGALVSNEFHVLTAKEDRLTNVYLWKVLRSEYTRAILEGYVTGGSRLRVGENTLKELLIPVPPLGVQKTFSSYILEAISKRKKLRKEILTVKKNAKIQITNILLQNLTTYETIAKEIISRSGDTLKELAKY